jgi:hypothetical protein
MVTFVMAWSPVRRFNAGRFDPGDYDTLNSYQPRDGTGERKEIRTIEYGADSDEVARV